MPKPKSRTPQTRMSNDIEKVILSTCRGERSTVERPFKSCYGEIDETRRLGWKIYISSEIVACLPQGVWDQGKVESVMELMRLAAKDAVERSRDFADELLDGLSTPLG